MTQVPEDWWDENLTDVEAFWLFIAFAVKIHINIILKYSIDPYLSNASALNKVKSLNHIISQVCLSHIHATNFANQVNLNPGVNQISSYQGRGHDRDNRFVREARHHLSY